MQDEQVRQRINDLSRVQLSLHSDRQAFPAVFIKDVERSERFPVFRGNDPPDCFLILLALAAMDARHVYHSLASLRLSAERQSDGSHIVHTDV